MDIISHFIAKGNNKSQPQQQRNSKQQSMPRLKKMSKINSQNDESNSHCSIGKFQIRKSDNKEDSNSKGNNSDERSSRSSQSSSEDQSSQTSHSARQNSNIGHTKSSQHPHKQNLKNTLKKKSSNKYNADQILKKLQQECANNQQQHSKQYEGDQTDAGIPDDVLVGFSGKKKNKKKKDNEIKVKNKLFADVVLQNESGVRGVGEDETEQLRRLEEEHRNILAQKNQKNAALMDERKNQIQSRVNRIRQRLQFKNGHEDARFKQHFKQTLNNVKDCEQVEIMIEAPKIFKGTSARQTDAALFIKNLSRNPSHHLSQSQPEDSVDKETLREKEKQKDKEKQKNKKIDRKQFYQQFTRQVKQINAVELPTQAAGLFKKSSLDQLQNQFQTHEHLFKQETNQRKSLNNSRISQRSQSISKIRVSGQGQKQRLSRQGSKMEKKTDQETKRESKKIEVVQEDISNQNSKNNNIRDVVKSQDKKPAPDSIKIELKAKQQPTKDLQQKQQPKAKTNEKQKNPKNQAKTKKPKSKGKRLTKAEQFDKKIKQLFEEQAQDSQNGYGDDGFSSEEGDDSSIQSMIDRNKVKMVAKNQREARKKFMNEEAKRDQQMLQKIKDRIAEATKIRCEQTSESRQRRRRRIADAQKKFEQQDKTVDGKFEDSHQASQNSSQTSQKCTDEFYDQLKSLQDQILKKKQTSKQKQQENGKGFNKKAKTVWQQIKITSVKIEPQANVQKRGGFLNNSKAITGAKIQPPKKHSSKPKNIIF